MMRTLIVLFACQLAFGVLNAEVLTGSADNDAYLPYFGESTDSEQINSESTNDEPTKNSHTTTDQSEFVNYQGAFLRKDLVQLLLEQLAPQTLSAECFGDLNDYRTGLQNGTSWAFKLYDSSSRQIDGLLGGTFLNLGDFEQCLATERSGQAIGKYFLISLVPQLGGHQWRTEFSQKEFTESNQNLERRFAFLFQFPDLLNVKLGLCLPRTCGNAEVQKLFNQTAKRFKWKVQKEVNSQTNDGLLTKIAASGVHVQLAFLVLVTILAVVLVASCLELLVKFKRNSLLHQFVECTAIRSNFRKLHSAEDAHSKAHNDFISKNRYYSEILVNFTHFVVFVPLLGGSVIYEHVFDWIENSDRVYYQLFFCDCYYPGLVLLASMTVSLKMWSFIRRQAAGGELVGNAIKRMMTFWPIIIVMISIQIAQPLLTQGPLVQELIGPVAENCQRNWWMNLLFIQNILPLEQQCLSFTWTISCELQLYLIATLLTYLYIRKPNLALALNVLLIAVGFLAHACVPYNGLTTANVMSFPFDYNSMRSSIFYSHSNTLVQLFPYFTMFLAFYLRLSKRTFKMSFENEMLVTTVLMLYFASTFHTSILFNVFKVKPNPLLNTAYYLYNRSSFTILTGWLIYRHYPNGTPTKRDEIKAWVRKRLGGGLLEILVERINRNLYGKETEKVEQCKGEQNEPREHSKKNTRDQCNSEHSKSDHSNSENELKVKDTSAAKRKVSSSESTSDLSDYSLLNESSDAQDRNNNFCFYDRRLIDLPEERPLDKQLSEQLPLERVPLAPEKPLQKSLHKQSSNEKTSDDERKETNKRPRRHTVQIWPKLSRSIYYSHFFWLLYSCFNVNAAQRSDIMSVAVSIHSKLVQCYLLSYVFHLLVEGAVTNLTNKLVHSIWPNKSHKD